MNRIKDPSYSLKLVLIFLAYYSAAWIGLRFDPTAGFATLVWAPTGIALASLFLFGYEYWPAVAAAAFSVNFVFGAGILLALIIALGNSLEAVVGVFLLKKFNFNPLFTNLKEFLKFFLLAAVVSTLVSSTVGTFGLLFANRLHSTGFFSGLGRLVVGRCFGRFCCWVSFTRLVFHSSQNKVPAFRRIFPLDRYSFCYRNGGFWTLDDLLSQAIAHCLLDFSFFGLGGGSF